MADEEEFVTIYETDLQPRVVIIKMALRDAGIRFIAVNDVVSSVLPVDGMAVIGFQVLARDAPRAREVVRALGFE